MKKLLCLIILMFSSAVCAYADDTADLTEVNVIIKLMENYNFTAADYATFTLSDGVNTYEQTIPVAANREALGMTFDVPEYTPGKSFTFTPVSGVQTLIYNDKSYAPGEAITITTKTYIDNSGKEKTCNTAHMKYIPVEGKEIYPYYNGREMLLPAPGLIINNSVMFPIEKTAEYIGIPTVIYNDSYNSYALIKDTIHLTFNMDNIYTSLSGKDFNSPTAPTFIDGIAYAPISVICDAFGIDLRVVQNDKGYEIFLKNMAQLNAEQYVNGAGLSSSTDYLIWVSKKNFTVNVFSGSKGNWTLVRSFPCSIGAPHTPTCEGTYRYYEAISKWDYGSYYVGPVMRFNGGYALHSTIVNKNGTMRDGRLRKMISHGCVRIDPPDMNWLFATAPLYTTVHVTGY